MTEDDTAVLHEHISAVEDNDPGRFLALMQRDGVKLGRITANLRENQLSTFRSIHAYYERWIAENGPHPDTRPRKPRTNDFFELRAWREDRSGHSELPGWNAPAVKILRGRYTEILNQILADARRRPQAAAEGTRDHRTSLSLVRCKLRGDDESEHSIFVGMRCLKILSTLGSTVSTPTPRHKAIDVMGYVHVGVLSGPLATLAVALSATTIVDALTGPILDPFAGAEDWDQFGQVAAEIECTMKAVKAVRWDYFDDVGIPQRVPGDNQEYQSTHRLAPAALNNALTTVLPELRRADVIRCDEDWPSAQRRHEASDPFRPVKIALEKWATAHSIATQWPEWHNVERLLLAEVAGAVEAEKFSTEAGSRIKKSWFDEAVATALELIATDERRNLAKRWLLVQQAVSHVRIQPDGFLPNLMAASPEISGLVKLTSEVADMATARGLPTVALTQLQLVLRELCRLLEWERDMIGYGHAPDLNGDFAHQLKPLILCDLPQAMHRAAVEVGELSIAVLRGSRASPAAGNEDQSRTENPSKRRKPARAPELLPTRVSIADAIQGRPDLNLPRTPKTTLVRWIKAPQSASDLGVNPEGKVMKRTGFPGGSNS